MGCVILIIDKGGFREVRSYGFRVHRDEKAGTEKRKTGPTKERQTTEEHFWVDI